jgi:hypothetical protein
MIGTSSEREEQDWELPSTQREEKRNGLRDDLGNQRRETTSLKTICNGGLEDAVPSTSF